MASVCTSRANFYQYFVRALSILELNNEDTLQEPCKTEEQRSGSFPRSAPHLIYNINQSQTQIFIKGVGYH